MTHLSKTSSERRALNHLVSVLDPNDECNVSSRPRSVFGSHSRSVSCRSFTASRSVSAVVGRSADGIHSDGGALTVWMPHAEPHTLGTPELPDGLPTAPCGNMSAFVQCVETMWGVSHKSGLAERWLALADGDGRVSIRTPDVVDPKSRGSLKLSAATMVGSVPRYLDVYVTRIVDAGSLLWAGYSDGALRAFHKRDRVGTSSKFPEVFEATRRHGGEVTDLLCTIIPRDAYGNQQPALISASNDFRVNVHHATECAFLFQLVSSGAYVRCLAVDAAGLFLFGGTDRGTIRCWSLSDCHEEVVSSSYPIHALSGPPPLSSASEAGRSASCCSTKATNVTSAATDTTVRCLQYVQNALYCACSNMVSVWDVESGSLTAAFEIPAPYATHCILVECNYTLWVAGSDGLLYMFDALDHTLLHTVSVHAATLIKTLNVVTRCPVVQLTIQGAQLHSLMLPMGRLRCGAAQHFETRTSEVLRQLVGEQAQLRRVRQELRALAALHRFCERLSGLLLERSLTATHAASSRLCALSDTSNRLVLKQQHRNDVIFSAVAQLLDTEKHATTAHHAFRKWLTCTLESVHQQQLRCVGQRLLLDAQETLQGNAVRKALRCQRKRQAAAVNALASKFIARRCHRGIARRYFGLWKAFSERNRLVAKLQDAALMMERNRALDRTSRMARDWVLWRWQAQSDRVRRLCGLADEEHAQNLTRTVESSQLRMQEASSFVAAKYDAVALTLGHSAELLLLRRYLSRWHVLVSHRRLERSAEALHRSERDAVEFAKEIDEARVSMSTSAMEEADLDAAIEAEAAELEALEKEAMRLEEVAVDVRRGGPQPSGEGMRRSASVFRASVLDSAEADVDVEHITDAWGNETVSHVSWCDSLMRAMTEFGVNCRSHAESLVEAHRVAQQRPVNTFMKLLEQAKAEVTSAFPLVVRPPPVLRSANPSSRRTSLAVAGAAAGAGGLEGTVPASVAIESSAMLKWPVDAGLLERANRIVLRRATVSLRQIVVAWSLLRPKLSKDQKLKNFNELTANAKMWLQLLERERLLEDQAIEKDPLTPWGGVPASLFDNAAFRSLRHSNVTAQPIRRTNSVAISASSNHGAAVAKIQKSPASSSRVASVQSVAAPRTKTPAAAAPVPSTRPTGLQPSPAAQPATSRYPMARRVVPVATPRTAVESKSRESATPVSAAQRSPTPKVARAASPSSPPFVANTAHRRSSPSVSQCTTRVPDRKSASGLSKRKEPSPVALESLWD